jgi:hypothetical protein
MISVGALRCLCHVIRLSLAVDVASRPSQADAYGIVHRASETTRAASATVDRLRRVQIIFMAHSIKEDEITPEDRQRYADTYKRAGEAHHEFCTEASGSSARRRRGSLFAE